MEIRGTKECFNKVSKRGATATPKLILLVDINKLIGIATTQPTTQNNLKTTDVGWYY
jgi:hypothetical protein